MLGNRYTDLSSSCGLWVAYGLAPAPPRQGLGGSGKDCLRQSTMDKRSFVEIQVSNSASIPLEQNKNVNLDMLERVREPLWYHSNYASPKAKTCENMQHAGKGKYIVKFRILSYCNMICYPFNSSTRSASSNYFFSNHLGSLSSKDLCCKKHNTSQKRKTNEPMNKKLSPELCSVSKVTDTIFRIPCSP